MAGERGRYFYANLIARIYLQAMEEVIGKYSLNAILDALAQIEVPDLGQGYVPVLAGQQSFGCLETAGAPEDPPANRDTWGRIKAGYR